LRHSRPFLHDALPISALAKLQTVKSENADKVIVAKAKESDIPATVAMAELIAARRLEPLKGELAKWMTHDNVELRSAAVFSMGLDRKSTRLNSSHVKI